MHSRTATRFFLGVYALFHATTVQADPQCAIDPKSIVTDACTSYAALDTLNADIAPSLHDLTEATDFFSYYRLNLFQKTCPFWADESAQCGNRACVVDTIENEQDIPEIWRAEELSKLEGLKAKHPGRQQQKERPKQRPLQYQLGENVDESCVLEDDDECDTRDYCVPEDEGAAAKGDYVSLVHNPERFTGYAGESAQMVWNAIYKENCFTSQAPAAARTASNKDLAAKSLLTVFQDYSRNQLDSSTEESLDLFDPAILDDQCVEQRAFYRIISGMHTSISTHLCYDYLNQTTGEWFHNTTCYRERLHKHPERLSNLYFNYALVTRALVKLRRHLEHYTFCSGDPEQDFSTKQKVLQLTSTLASSPTTFDESLLFKTDLSLKDDFKNRFRNVSRIMDCVGCERCRLWGKVQTAGYGAALKILFEFDETKNGENPHLRRTELVALHSLDALKWFRAAIAEEDAQNAKVATDKKTVTQSDLKRQVSSKPAFNDATFHAEASQRPKRHRDEPETLKEAFIAEWNLVWRAYKMVLRSWFQMPGKLFNIGVGEANRLWAWFIGLPVPQRSWDVEWIQVPRRDEL
ncbi:Endoplasmic reticulum oxidoreductin-1 [Cyphellophora attinorum]|uniref:Endoplasmic reticulum oxidoreductin-1 n=1 Tax=Cyphellophora attinorum TaxID=1664694 RepID=A0A0N0NQ67_9EURO|nr:Endoplasmic reticulum oxidoreductin-1 [Phialophora attinorum]KPI43349.1 Endoplasmic reticulum oxidoreductin-1 [Phialophora attinorum]